MTDNTDNQITVIIPVYNSEKHIECCIDSILSQTYPGINIICVNDGSTDNSERIIDEYIKKGAPVKQIIKKNDGVSAARNDGIDSAETEYLVFVDSDDYLDPDYIEKLAAGIDTYDMSLSGYSLVDENSEVIITYDCQSFSGQMSEFVSVMDNYLFPPFLLSACFKLFRKSILDRYKIRFRRDISYGEDALFAMDYLSRIDRIRCIEGTGYNYRRHGSGTLSGRFFKDKIDIMMEIGKSIVSLYSERGRDDGNLFLNDYFCTSFVQYLRELCLSDLSLFEKRKIFNEKKRLYNALKRFKAKDRRSIGEQIIYISLRMNCLSIACFAYYVYAIIYRIKT